MLANGSDLGFVRRCFRGGWGNVFDEVVCWVERQRYCVYFATLNVPTRCCKVPHDGLFRRAFLGTSWRYGAVETTGATSLMSQFL